MIICRNIKSHYPKTNNGLHNFSCEIEPGIHGLLGKNGSGKTTLIRNLIGALFPQSGTCTIDGESPSKRNPNMLKEIFFIPEEFYFPLITPKLYINVWSGFYPKFDKTIMYNLIDEWEIPKNSLIGKMSHGQKKKFLIAFALSTRSKFLFFDEPTNGLDITSKILFKNIISRYSYPEQTLIISTHQVKDIDSLVNNLIIINDGAHQGSFAIKEINQKLICKNEKQLKKDQIFSIKTNDGYLALSPNPKPSLKVNENQVDLEIFFIAFLEKKEIIKKILGEK